MEEIKNILQSDEIVDPSSPDYANETVPWAAQKDEKPTLVVRPKTLSSLSKILAHLSKTSLDFAVRSSGYGSASTKGVLISMGAFNGFEFDRKNEIVTLGAGQCWGDYYKKMEEIAPDYTGQ